MEKDFNNRDFERFVKQNADQYRMFPSDSVWKGVHDALHRRRRWYGIGLALLLVTTAVVTWVMLIPANKASDNEQVASSSTIIEAKEIPAELQSTNDAATPAFEKNKPFITSLEDLKQEPLKANQPGTARTNNAVTSNIGDDNTEPVIDISLASSAPVKSAVASSVNPGSISKPGSSPAIPEPAFLSVDNKANITDDPSASNVAVAATKPVETQETKKLPLIPERNSKDKSITRISRKKLNWQFFLTPTVSYRKLEENTAYISAARYNNIVNGTGGNLPYTTDVNTMVNHKPDMGFQLGARAAYPLSRWLSITGGFQFSVSKYDIKAYDHPAEMTTIALSDRNVSTVSSLRNTNGYRENWLRNFYFSASVPVGLELRLSDGEKNYFGVAGTVQPTYVLDNRAYLISADYKNYAEMPSLTRRWNMNTSFEVFSSHTTGKVKWRIGPQVRYQAMSSFAKNYPIKEHLFDFGLKLGIQLK